MSLNLQATLASLKPQGSRSRREQALLHEYSSSLYLVMFANIPGALVRSGGGRSQEGVHRVKQTTALALSHLLTGYSHLCLSPTYILHSMCLVPSLNGVHSIYVGINTQEHCDPAFALPLVSCVRLDRPLVISGVLVQQIFVLKRCSYCTASISLTLSSSSCNSTPSGVWCMEPPSHQRGTQLERGGAFTC